MLLHLNFYYIWLKKKASFVPKKNNYNTGKQTH